jgi:hypothetical protein
MYVAGFRWTLWRAHDITNRTVWDFGNQKIENSEASQLRANPMKNIHYIDLSMKKMHWQ